jgi:hypothetical protein
LGLLVSLLLAALLGLIHDLRRGTAPEQRGGGGGGQ